MPFLLLSLKVCSDVGTRRRALSVSGRKIDQLIEYIFKILHSFLLKGRKFDGQVLTITKKISQALVLTL